MTYMKQYGTRLFFMFLELITLLFLLTIIYYFDYIDDKTYAFFKIVLVLGSILIHSFLLEKKATHKDSLKGFHFGTLLIFLFFIPTLLFSQWQWKTLFYYFLILATSTLGGMLGTCQKKKTKKRPY